MSRTGYYYQTVGESSENLILMRLLDELYTKYPFYGSRRMSTTLNAQGYRVNRKRIQRLMRLMGIEAIYPKPDISKVNQRHKVYPYLLRNISIERINQVWSADITYIPMESGFMYLVAIIDWYSRYVLAWELSNTLDASFCLHALNNTLQRGKPEIFNTDQGSQFTSEAFTGCLKDADIATSMDGCRRALDNIFIERLWRSVKYENIYINAYETVAQLVHGLSQYFYFYNNQRPHQALKYKTPAAVYNK